MSGKSSMPSVPITSGVSSVPSVPITRHAPLVFRHPTLILHMRLRAAWDCPVTAREGQCILIGMSVPAVGVGAGKSVLRRC
jgi:hypothetical protein